MATPPKKKKNAVWLLMVQCEQDRNRARCTLCNTTISCGTEKSRTTTNMQIHLQGQHLSEWTAAKKQADETQAAHKRASIASPSMGVVDLSGDDNSTPSTIHQSQLTLEVSDSELYFLIDLFFVTTCLFLILIS